MSTPLIDPEPPPKRPVALTFVRTNGKPYGRFADVEAQIAEVITRPVADWPAVVLEATDRHWRPQTLVHLARLARGNERVFGRLVYEVVQRAGPVIARWAQGYGLATFEEIAGETTTNLIKLVMALPATRTSEYLEIDFDQIVKQETLKAQRRHKDEPKPSMVSSAAQNDDRPDPLDRVEDDSTRSPLEALLAKGRPELLRPLLKAVTDPRHRKAFILRHLRGWPMFDANPATPTLSTYFSPVSKRQIQNWITRAEEQIRAAYGDLE